MLAGLDDILWADLEHAYGPARDVPALLRQLLERDPKVRSRVMQALYSNVFHQGTRYPATPHVIPFLMELCASPDVPDRGELLRYWGRLITGFFSIQERPTWGDGTRIHDCGQVQPGEDNNPYCQALHEIYARSLAGETLLYQLLSNEDVSIRAGAAWVLACLPTIKDRSVKPLRDQLRAEASGWVRASIAFALGEIEDSASLERLLDGDYEHAAAQCIAACQLARIAPSERLITPLLRFICEPIDGYNHVPGAGGHSTGDASFSITHLPITARQRAVPAICEQLKRARSFATMPLVTALLSAAFEPTNRPLTELTELQRRVLRCMVDTEELWSIGNVFFTLQAYGIPHDRTECAQLLGAKVAKDDAISALSSAVTHAEMGFLDLARDGIDKALLIDPAVFARAPSPEECWLYCAKAFAETDRERALRAFDNARSINPHVIHRVGATWQLAELLSGRGSD